MEPTEENTETTPSQEKRIRRPKQIDPDLGYSSISGTNNSSKANLKPVCLIPRPWRYIDGLLNRPVLKQMLESILLYLKTYPNSTGESIAEHYCPFLHPVMTRELLEMLERLKCVHKKVLSRENPCDLFSDFTNESRELNEDDDELLGNEIYAYYLTQISMFTFKKVFPN